LSTGTMMVRPDRAKHSLEVKAEVGSADVAGFQVQSRSRLLAS
jgi:hypothetical protein